jgi:hypothetical protein
LLELPGGDADDALKAPYQPPRIHRSEFRPAIPRRVAPQQSPLPLRRIVHDRIRTKLSHTSLARS